jgi:hypothetical protein
MFYVASVLKLIASSCSSHTCSNHIPFHAIIISHGLKSKVGEEVEFDLYFSDPPCGASIFTDPNGQKKCKVLILRSVSAIRSSSTVLEI